MYVISKPWRSVKSSSPLLTADPINGFSLIELLLSLLLSSILALALFQFYPSLYRSTQMTVIEMQRYSEAEQILERIRKDLSRAGFVAQDPQTISEPLLTLSANGECLIISYDLERTGSLNFSTLESDSDRLGYRLHEGNIEYKRGASSCTGSNWYKLNDSDTMRVTVFRVTELSTSFHLQLQLTSKSDPSWSYQVQRYVQRRNN